MKQNIASAPPLPPVSVLQAFAEHTRKEGALSEYWFIHNSTPGKHRKPVYGWAGGKSALDKKTPHGLGTYVSWESVVSATWEQLTGAEPIEGYQAMLGDNYPVARAVISTGTRRSWLPLRTASSREAPSRSSRWRKWVIIMMPLRVAMPNRVMKPTR